MSSLRSSLAVSATLLRRPRSVCYLGRKLVSPASPASSARSLFRSRLGPATFSKPFPQTRVAAYSTTTSAMEVELKANGKTWSQPLGLFINNEFVKSSTGDKIVTINPTTEEEICAVYAASAADVDTAVAAARKALRDPSWKKLSGTERAGLMFKLATLVEENAEILATIETLDNGKPYSVALEEDIGEFHNVIRYYAGYADKNHGQLIDVSPSKMAYTLKQPVGVCGQIIPWNYPLDMAAWKLGPALCCGNTVVLKLAEQTPLSMLYMGKLIKEAGFPPGVINIVNGYGREAGAAIASHPGIDKIAFTGSTGTGREIMKMAAGTLKNITLETGGKSPLLVFEDADLDLAATWAHGGIMSNQGQICTATSRILVQKSVHDKFVELFKKTVKDVSVVGDPFEKTTFQGPQVTKAQYERVLGYVKIGREEGATVAMGGEPVAGPLSKDTSKKGFFVAPTVFTEVKPSMKVYREEIFGPCVVIASFETEEEAVEMANDTTYGLGAALFTKDITRGHRVARDIEAGMVWINSSNDSDFRVPFGGVKQSGIGRELGEAGLAAYSVIKAVHVNMDA